MDVLERASDKMGDKGFQLPVKNSVKTSGSTDFEKVGALYTAVCRFSHGCPIIKYICQERCCVVVLLCCCVVASVH